MVSATGATQKTQVTGIARGVNDCSLPGRQQDRDLDGYRPSCTDIACDDSAKSYAPGPGDGRLYEGDGGFYRHWDSWETPGTYSRVFAFPLRNGRVSGEGVAVDGPLGAGGPVGDTPSMPFGGGEDLAWAPDGSGIYFAARKADTQEPYSELRYLVE